MRFHSDFCHHCEEKTLFLEKLVDPSDVSCDELHDICQKCKSEYHVHQN